MKKTLFKLFALSLCSVFVFSIVACSENENVSGTKVTYCESSRTVLREEDFTGGDTFVLNTFKGDVESGQIIVNPDKDVEKFNFSVNGLTREGGSETLASDLFEIYAERYIEVTQSTSGNTYFGWYADALVPIKKYAAKRDNKIKKGNNQGIWINLNVPVDAVPGTYKGNGTLTLDDETIDVPMTVNIYNIDMPEEVHAVTSFRIDEGMIPVGEGKAVTPELAENYYNFVVSKRVTPRDLPGYSGVAQKYPANDFARDCVKYAKDGKVSAYALPYTRTKIDIKGVETTVVEYNYCVEILTALALKNVELRQAGDDTIDLFKKAHYYLGSVTDEPDIDRYDQVRECDQRITNAKFAVANSGILDDYPDLKESLFKVCNVVTVKITETLYGTDDKGGVQTWCPLIDNFDSESKRELALERMASTDRTGGESVWWYTCINPKNPYPTYHLDDNYLTLRLLKWMQYDYKIQGDLFWCVNYWKMLKNNVPSGYDLWNVALNYESCNKDGMLIYPGSKYGVNGPISTLRLEGLRESAEDYELLWLTEKGIDAINEEYGKDYDPDKVLQKFYGRLYEDLFLNEGVTSSDFETIRCELMTLVEKIYNDKTAAISLLDEYNR